MCSFQTKKLKDDAEKRKASLEVQLEDLKKDLSLFQTNSESLIKLANIWEKIDRNNENKMTACRDFVFYSLMGTALINIGLLKELIGINDYARYIMYPSLIVALGVISVAYAAKRVFSILAHRNGESDITENERKDLLECFPLDS